MAKRICPCGKPAVGRGLCDPHYRKAKREGNLPPIPERRHTLETLMANVVKTEGCWLWTGCKRPDGYGRVHRGKAHRRIYEFLVGPIPDGMTLDHECHNQDRSCSGGPACPHRACVRPDHLVPRPPGENAMRSANSTAVKHAAKTHCPQGHEYTPENTALGTWNGRPTRGCRTCKYERNRHNYERKKGVA